MNGMRSDIEKIIDTYNKHGKLSRKSAIKLFRFMCHWIADESEKQNKAVSKEDFYKKFKILLNKDEDEVICRYAIQICEKNYSHNDIWNISDLIVCRNCPIKWNNNCDTWCIDSELSDFDDILYDYNTGNASLDDVIRVVKKLETIPVKKYGKHYRYGY